MRRTRCKVYDIDECTPGSKIVHGYCSKHGYRAKKFGDPLFLPKRVRPAGAGRVPVPVEVVKRWRWMRARGWGAAEIAREYGVARDTVYRRTNVTDERKGR